MTSSATVEARSVLRKRGAEGRRLLATSERTSEAIRVSMISSCSEDISKNAPRLPVATPPKMSRPSCKNPQGSGMICDDHGPMNWDDLRYVLALAEGGSLARAARKLKVDHTTVGRRIEALEADLDIRLFARTTSGYVLTRDAEELLPDIRRIESNVLAFERSCQAGDRRLRGTIRVTGSEALGSRYVAPRLVRFTRQHPDISLEFITGIRAFDLARREADVAIRLFRSEDEYLIVKRAADLGFSLYASEEYLHRRPVPQKGAELSDHDLINLQVPGPSPNEGTWLEELGHSARIALTTNSTSVALNAAVGGVGIALLPRIFADAEPTLRRIPMPNEPTRPVWLTVHKDLRRAPRIRALLDFLTEMFRVDAALLRDGYPAARPNVMATQ